MIAGLQITHARADFGDFAGALVADDHRHRSWAVAVDDGKIGVAEAGGAHADEHFAAAGRVEIDFFDDERASL
jgi:hypothetical protein